MKRHGCAELGGCQGGLQSLRDPKHKLWTPNLQDKQQTGFPAIDTSRVGAQLTTVQTLQYLFKTPTETSVKLEQPQAHGFVLFRYLARRILSMCCFGSFGKQFVFAGNLQEFCENFANTCNNLAKTQNNCDPEIALQKKLQ